MTRVSSLVMLILALLAVPLAAGAQPGSKGYRIAIVVSALPVAEMTSDAANRAFFDELQRLGFVEGQNLVVEQRSALGHPERL
jgi:putative ABC transport system substrate-binding protein